MDKKHGNNWTAYYDAETGRYFAEIIYTSREGREQYNYEITQAIYEKLGSFSQDYENEMLIRTAKITYSFENTMYGTLGPERLVWDDEANEAMKEAVLKQSVQDIKYKIATDEDMELLMSSRLEMLKVVNGLDANHKFSDEIIRCSEEYFRNGDHTTVLAMAGDRVIGCATICYMYIMPTYSHPTGKRAHLMNVYTNKEWRRHGIAMKMVSMLIDEARKRGVTEISLDATKDGRPLYNNLGFTDSGECMVLERL